MIKRFNRYELKYSIPVATMARLLPDLMRFLKEDPHAEARGFYKVSSLYFDTPDLDCYRNKIDGLLFRRKLRIRVYPDVPDGPAFVEIKQRINRTVQKRRLAMTLADAYRLCSGDMRFHVSEQDDQEVADEVHCLVRSLRLTPRNVITYTRQAWMGYFMDPGLRVTFDTMVRTRSARFDLELPRRLFLAYPPGRVIMEIKANERVPHWLTTTLARHECSLERISKYCHGMSQIMKQERLRWEAG